LNTSELRPGEIVLREATRSFSIRADQARTLKGLLLGRRVPGPAPVPALQGVSLHIAPGETVGIVGRNGAGKTSTLRVLAGIVPLDSGEAACGGRIVALLELAAGFSRDFSGRENILLQGALYGLTRAELEERIERIIAFSELKDFIDIPVKTYSAGMFVRLGFSIAAHLDADVLLMDEVLAVGDEAFQRKCLRRISEQIAAGATVVLVSHDAGAIERVCERVVVLDHGKVIFDGPTAEGLLHYHRLMGTEQGAGTSLRPARDGEVEIVDVDLRNGLGRQTSVFRSGESLQLVVGLRATKRFERCTIVLELRSQEGTVIFATTHECEQGAQVVFEIPELVLLGGDYDFALGAVTAGDQADLERTVRFSVAREPEREGLIDLRGTWRALATVQEVR
jgi:ABC-type polysaccharide/polyol phosphate transport system ATPase subunit